MNFMKKYTFICFFIFLSFLSSSFGYEDHISKLSWNDAYVLHKSDSRLPLFEIQIFFSDGALSDHSGKYGLTQLLFDHLRSGTNRLSKKEIDSALEFSAISLSSYVSHEYSVIKLSGLMDHLIPATKLFCHLVKDSNFPQNEINKYVTRETNSLNNLVASPPDLTNRVFRKVNLKGTPYEEPVEGTLKSLPKIKTEDLKHHLKYFKESVMKKFYLAGPDEILIVRSILLNECGFNFETSKFVRSVPEHKVKTTYKGGEIYFIPLEGLNQAQIRFGKYLHHTRGNKDILKDLHLMSLVSEYLGGGFSSLLNRELRTKRGLVYSVNAVASVQKEYGRSVVLTSTRLDGVEEAIKVIKESLNKLVKGEIDKNDLDRTINYLFGSFMFGLETNSSYLSQLMLLDHLGKDYSDLFNYPSIIKSYTAEDVQKMAKEIFDPKDHVILITAPKSLASKLRGLPNIHFINYHDFL